MLLILTVINIFLASYLIDESANYQQISSAFVLMLIPYTLAEIPSLLGREGISLKDSWKKRFVETGTWVFFTLVILEIVQVVG